MQAMHAKPALARSAVSYLYTLPPFTIMAVSLNCALFGVHFRNTYLDLVLMHRKQLMQGCSLANWLTKRAGMSRFSVFWRKSL